MTGRPCLNIPIIIEDHSERKNNNIIYKIHANFKDRLLHLFSYMNKTFKLFVSYTMDSQNYTVTFITPIPTLENLEDYKSNKKFTDVYMPVSMPRGKELMRLFKNRFHLKHDSSEEETSLHKDLM